MPPFAFAAASPGDLVVCIAERLIDNIEPVVDQLKEDADEFEELVRLMVDADRSELHALPT